MMKQKEFPLYIEMNGKGRHVRLFIGDCRYLDHFESTLVLVRTGGCTVRIGGRMLEISLLESGGVEIVGEVREVSFLYAK